MKAFAGVLAVLLMLSSGSFAQTAPAASAASTDAGAATAGAVPAAAWAPRLAPGAKVFLEPMGGFEQLLADSIVHKKVPVVVVKERADADFVMSGVARVKNRGFVTAFVLSAHGGVNVSMKDARTGNLVFACKLHRVDSMERDGDIYLGWADQCAGHLKKAMKKK